MSCSLLAAESLLLGLVFQNTDCMKALNCQRDLFELDHEHVWLNCSYFSPQLKSVTEAGIQELRRKATPWDYEVDDFFAPTSALKLSFAQLIGAIEAERVALIPSTSYGLANVAKNVPVKQGQKIILLADCFPSAYHTFKALADEKGAALIMVDTSATAGRGKAWNNALLDAIDEQTALVVTSHVHWVDGTKFDLKAIRQRSREVGALMVIDGTQSVGALPLNVAEVQPDALICAGYKWLMGPYALGYAWYGPAFDNGTPIEQNWKPRVNSDDFSNLINYQEEYRPFSNRYSMGEASNFTAVKMALQALEQLNAWTPEAIADYVRRITQAGIDELRNMGCALEEDAYRAAHLFSIRLGDQLDADRLKQELTDRKVSLSFRGDAVRVAPHVYNTSEEVNTMVDCFKAALR